MQPPFIPRMPWFEPSDEPSAKALLLSQAVTESNDVLFPADLDFWSNFVQEVQKYPGAMDPPYFDVDASHTDQSVRVNQEFLRRFVSGWEKANPHVVVVSTPHGASTFHSSEEFWNRFVTMAGQRSRMRAARGELGLEDTTVTSKMLPNMAPIKTTEEDWNDICRTWEQEKSVGNAAPPPQPPAPLPPSPAPITQVAPPQSQRLIPLMPWFEPSDEPSAKALLSQAVTESDHFTFPADHDFWNNFVQEVQRYPGAMNRPHYHVDASHTDQSVLVNQEFLRRFVSGWEKANPHVVVVSTPHGASTFHSSEEFWNRFVTMAGQRSRMRAARGELGLEDTTVTSKMLPNMAPIKTTEEDWNDICRTWAQEKSVGIQEPFPMPSPSPETTERPEYPNAEFDDTQFEEEEEEQGEHTVNYAMFKPPVPAMTWFQPSSRDHCANALLMQPSVPFDLSLLTDDNFNRNLNHEMLIYPGAMDPPLFEDFDDGQINKGFLCRFAHCWLQQHPHKVTVASPFAATSFHADRDFWPWFVEQVVQTNQQSDSSPKDHTVTTSSRGPHVAFSVTEECWREICFKWEHSLREPQKLNRQKPAKKKKKKKCAIM